MSLDLPTGQAQSLQEAIAEVRRIAELIKKTQPSWSGTLFQVVEAAERSVGETRRAFLDGIDWQHHLGQDPEGAVLYPRPEDAVRENHCLATGSGCGLVEVDVKLVRWVEEQDLDRELTMGKVAFRGRLWFCSNFYNPSPVTLDGIEYESVEHAYAAAKTTDQVWRLRIQLSETPGEAKKMGRRAPLRADWEEIKLSVMEGLLRQKFAPGSTLAQKLLDTGDEHLEETNTWGDKYWGVCNGEGLNHLGLLLMKIRAELKVAP